MRETNAEWGLCSPTCKQCPEHPEELQSWWGAEWVPEGPQQSVTGLSTVGGPGSAPSVLRRHMYGCERASCRAGVPGSCHKAGGDGATQTSGPPASPVTAQAASVPSLHTAVAVQRVGFQQAVQQAGPLSTAAGPRHSPAHRQPPRSLDAGLGPRDSLLASGSEGQGGSKSTGSQRQRCVSLAWVSSGPFSSTGQTQACTRRCLTRGLQHKRGRQRVFYTRS